MIVFDPAVHVLGSLCRRGHNHEGTGQSVRYISCKGCVQCATDRQEARKAALQTPEEIAAYKERQQQYQAKSKAKPENKEKAKARRKLYLETPEARELVQGYDRKRNLLHPEKKKAKDAKHHKKQHAARLADPEKLAAYRDYQAAYRRNRLLTDPEFRARLEEHEKNRKARRDADPEFVAQHKAYMTEYARQRRANDPVYRLRLNMSRSINTYIHTGKQGKSWAKIVGYSLDKIRAHLEAQFTDGMTWENYGTFWEVDHIIPMAAFAITGPDDPLVRKAWALSNLRPLVKRDNRRKNAKLVLRSP